MMSKVSADCTRWSFNSSLFHTRRPATAKQRSPNNDSVHGTVTVIDSADLKPALALQQPTGWRDLLSRMVRRHISHHFSKSTPCAEYRWSTVN